MLDVRNNTKSARAKKWVRSLGEKKLLTNSMPFSLSQAHYLGLYSTPPER